MESKELTVIERAAVALGTAKHEQELLELVKKSESITFIKNAAGRDQCHGALMTLKSARVAIEKVGKAAREDATQFSKAIIAEEKRLIAITQAEEARLQEIRDAWDEAREREKREKAEAEARRVSKIREAIEDFRRAPGSCPGKTAAEFDEHADDLARAPIELDFYMELTGEAEAARDVAVAALRDMANKARQREAEEARVKAELLELARLRAEQEERDRIAAAERAEQERKAREALEAEEARLRAERAEEEAKLRAERAEHERRMAAERAEFQRRQDELAAEQRRAAAELQRQQDEIAAERRRVADEEARKQREADAAAAKALQEKLEAEAREIEWRQAEFAALQKAAPALLDACRQFVKATDACDDEELENAYQAATAAIAAATLEEVPA
ncbi:MULTISPECIES: hypothetical protein [unclassified Caballeronia]|uniref:hypothetical protein n=1 Tax=unclassified Caballeronia TaxID=2646786 RepID=UPI001F235BB5|nr:MULTISPECIES: hypothetical protein [unclassified Caballeronia]MCE4544621.1 hypothetical protein [Caballeronia sp. PC1]MCE4571773.1 hypothetical protein [Caballeronia sp. CLC5]